MVIYTKLGDKGTTSLYDASASQRKRISKSSLKIQAIGAVDELNSYIGIVLTVSESKKLERLLSEIQRDLLTIGSILAGSELKFADSKTIKLEKIIDEIEGKLPPLKNFILPGGSTTSSHLHYARSIARRMERMIVKLNERETVLPEILKFINRLSDLFFMLARNENYRKKIKEDIWFGGK